MEDLDYIKQELNESLDRAKNEFNQLKSYQKHLNNFSNKSFNGKNTNDLSQALSVITSFMEGAFDEVNKSIINVNKSLNEQMKKKQG